MADEPSGQVVVSGRTGHASTARAIAAATLLVAGLVAAAGCAGAGLFDAVLALP